MSNEQERTRRQAILLLSWGKQTLSPRMVQSSCQSCGVSEGHHIQACDLIDPPGRSWALAEGLVPTTSQRTVFTTVGNVTELWKTHELKLRSCRVFLVTVSKRQVFHQCEKWKQSKTTNTCITQAVLTPLFWPPYSLRWWAPTPWLAVHHDWHTGALLLSRCPSLPGNAPSWRDPTLNCSECKPVLKWTFYSYCLCPSPPPVGENPFISKWGHCFKNNCLTECRHHIMLSENSWCQNFWRGSLRKATESSQW